MGLKKKIRVGLRKIGLIRDVEAIKKEQANYFFTLFEGTVAYGPLVGVKMRKNQWWSIRDIPSKLFGVYESEVVHEIVKCSSKCDLFVNIGAADGFFGVGFVKGGFFKKSACFEISSEARLEIAEVAKLNRVCSKVKIFGEATVKFLERIREVKKGKAFFLIDIEGAEFALLTDEFIRLCSKCPIIVEIHDWLVADGEEEMRELRQRVLTRYNIEVLQTKSRDLSAFTELDFLPDAERWMVCDEGRGKKMEWWYLTPKKISA